MGVHKSQIRVLYIAGRIGIMNGAYHSLLSSVVELKKMGVTPIVLLHTHGSVEDGFRENGVKCYVLPFCGCTVPADNPSRLKGIVKEMINRVLEPAVKRIMKKESIDLVHINASTSSIGAVSALRKGIPLVWHLREFLEEDVNLTYINKEKTAGLLRKADRIIAISDAVAEHFRKEYGIRNCVTVYNGISFQQTLSVKKKPACGTFCFALVGRIVRTKGQLEALMAFHKAVRQGCSIARLLIVGDVGDQDYYKELCDYVRQSGLESQVEIMDHQKNLVPVWKQSDVALICSTREGFGRVTAEFMLNGVPVIGADTGGTPELLRDGRGLIYHYGDLQDLAGKMIFSIQHYDQMIQMAEEAREYAMHAFTAVQCAAGIKEVYDDILDSRNR